MAKTGWHLQSVSGLNKYIFIKSEPKNMVYQLDFNTSPLDEEYLQFFKDSVCSYLGRINNWKYFVKEYDSNGVNEIFTEYTDLINRNKKILGVLFPILILNIIIATQNILNSINFIKEMGVLWYTFFILLPSSFASSILIFAIIKIMNKNKYLTKQHL